MTLSEAIEAATRIIGCYPNGGANAGKSYIGSLAAIIASYPRQVAQSCADPLRGVVRECKFLPTVADIVAWCEKAVEPLYGARQHEIRIEQQLESRREFEHQEAVERPQRKTVEQLKERFGDWHDGWRPAGEISRALYDKARTDLVAQIGEKAFDALPDAPQRGAAE